ncbi:MAG: 16S rRNA (guanine(527)-N(7))-methyltransferase RsmG [Nitrospiraceae bacterium]
MHQEGRWGKVLLEGAAEFGIGLSARQVSELTVYAEELIAWNNKINLTAITHPDQIAIKHFVDSLACSQAIMVPPAHAMLDIGAGAGFPGLPLKILYPELDLILLEPSQKKTAFLRHLIGTLDLKRATVLPKRIQDIVKEPDYQGRFTSIVTRALGVGTLLRLLPPLLTKQGKVILCRSKPLENKMDPNGLRKTKEIGYELPRGYGHRVLTVLEPALPISAR